MCFCTSLFPSAFGVFVGISLKVLVASSFSCSMPGRIFTLISFKSGILASYRKLGSAVSHQCKKDFLPSFSAIHYFCEVGLDWSALWCCHGSWSSPCWLVSLFLHHLVMVIALGSETYLEPTFFFQSKYSRFGGWRGDSVVESCSSCRGLRLDYQHPHVTARNCPSLWYPGICYPLLISVGQQACMHLCTYLRAGNTPNT